MMGGGLPHHTICVESFIWKQSAEIEIEIEGRSKEIEI